MSDEKYFNFVMNGLCIINRVSVILNKVILEQDLTKNDKKIIEQIVKLKGLDEV